MSKFPNFRLQVLHSAESSQPLQKPLTLPLHTTHPTRACLYSQVRPRIAPSNEFCCSTVTARLRDTGNDIRPRKVAALMVNDGVRGCSAYIPTYEITAEP